MYWVVLNLYEVFLFIGPQVTKEVSLGCGGSGILKRTGYWLKVLTTKSSLWAAVFNRFSLPFFLYSFSSLFRPLFRSLDFVSLFCEMSLASTCFAFHTSYMSEDYLFRVDCVSPFEVEGLLCVRKACIDLQSSTWYCSAMISLDDYLFYLYS